VNRLVRNALLRVAAAALLAVTLLPLSGNVAWACICDQFTPVAAAAHAATVFTGVVRGSVEPTPVNGMMSTGWETRIDFNVYRGAAPSRWSVRTDNTSCGYEFSYGERYTVFVTGEDKTNTCMGNVRGAIDPATYGVRAITTYPAQSLDDPNTGLIALAALVVVALGAVAAIRMRRLRTT
jgi:hypothetical protein